MFLRGETYRSSANVSATFRPNIPKFLFKVKKGDQVQYNPPLRTIDLSIAQAVPHFPKPTKRRISKDSIIKRWSFKKSFRKSKDFDSPGSNDVIPRASSSTSQPHNFVKRWSLKRQSNNRGSGLSGISSDWSATDELDDVLDDEVFTENDGNTSKTGIRRWSAVVKQRSIPKSVKKRVGDTAAVEANGAVKIKQSRSLRDRRMKADRASWRLSLQDALTGANKACVYLQDTGTLSPSLELKALKRTLSDAQFYKENSALMFLFPESDPTPKSRFESLIGRSNSRKSQLEKDEERELKRWKKRFMGVNKKFVLKHLVSFQNWDNDLMPFELFVRLGVSVKFREKCNFYRAT